MDDNLFEVYLRTKDGETYHPGNIREGIEQFLSEDGYRISFNIEGVVITIRKDCIVDTELQYLDRHTGSKSVNGAITIRGI